MAARTCLTILAVMTTPHLAQSESLWVGPIPVEYDWLPAFDCEGQRVFGHHWPDGDFVVASHRDTEGNAASEVAMSFVAHRCPLLGLGWLGHYFSTPIRPTFEVRLFADDDGRPGEILHSWDAGDAYEYVGAPSLYWIETYPAIQLVAGDTYWASAVAEAFDPQWGVVGSVPDGGATSVRSPYFGVETWTPLDELLSCDPCSMALFVFADSDCVATPVARTHWTRLKAMFR